MQFILNRFCCLDAAVVAAIMFSWSNWELPSKSTPDFGLYSCPE